MIREASKQAPYAIIVILAGIVAFAIGLSAPALQAMADEGDAGLAAALETQADDVEYSIWLDGVPYGGDYGIYAKPGESLQIEPRVLYRDDSWRLVISEGATFAWTRVDERLKAAADGRKLTIAKLPEAGTYKATVVAYNAESEEIAKRTIKIVVNKAPKINITMPVFEEEGGQIAADSSSIAINTSLNLRMGGAFYGWDNNTEKPFYKWTVTNVKTGQVVKWNANKGKLKKNPFVYAVSVPAAATPYATGQFMKAGTYKIKATVFHSDKIIATATKTVKAY